MGTLKLLGTLLILGAGVGTAWRLVSFEKKKLLMLDRWIDLIDYIRMQIDCYLTPLDRILDRGADGLVPLGEGSPGLRLESMLSQSRFYLDRESLRLLESFLHEIGNGYREEQVRRCDFFLSALREIRKKKQEELPNRLRLEISLCVCFALALTILCW